MTTILKHPLPFENEIVAIQKDLLEKLNSGDDRAVSRLEKKLNDTKLRVYKNLSPYQKVLLARHQDRPTACVLIRELIKDFLELHGDRRFGDDPSTITGLGKLGSFRIAVVAQEKGQTIRDKPKRNFGMPLPEGYRKALKLFRLAEKFRLPILTIVDTPGAFPGDNAEERGQAQAIAENLLELAFITVPTISVILGEGGSGGALALGLTDKIFMFENAYYSVISPEGCASILYGEEGQNYVAECASMLKISASDLKSFGIIDDIIPEPLGGLHWGYEESFKTLADKIVSSLLSLVGIKVEELLERRKKKYYSMGIFETIKDG